MLLSLVSIPFHHPSSPHLWEHLVAFFSLQHPVFQRRLDCKTGRLPYSPRLDLVEAIITTHPVQPHPHHPFSPASCILSHLSSVVSSWAIFIYYLSSSIFIKSPALPCIVHTLPLSPCNKTLLKPTYFVSLAPAYQTTCKRKENREREKKKLKESKRKEPKRYTHSEKKVHPLKRYSTGILKISKKRK